jgi:putative flippase GtrA
VTLLRHAVNQGKGQALKTAMNHVLLHHAACPGIVTADADDQHLVEDILKVASALTAEPDKLWLGCRAFSGEVPFRSMIGNRITKQVFRLVFSQSVSDTQTGLRGIPRTLLPALLRCPAARYEFEMEMFVIAKQEGMPLREVPIQTVYIDGNRMSHFNPLLDSLRIYFVLVRFSALAIATATLDFAVFSAMFALFHNVLLSITVSRLFAGVFNFLGGKRWVFKSGAAPWREAVRYVALVLVLMGLSYSIITTLVVLLKFNVLAAKVLGEGFLFLLSFSVQNQFVFRDRAGQAAPIARTDWDAYYDAPVQTAHITRKFTQAMLIGHMRRFAEAHPVRRICELGGANSCFFAGIRAAFRDALYTIVDTNQKGLDLFRAQHQADAAVELINGDVLALEQRPASDIVFSTGLIEHFSTEGTAQAIRAHFASARPGALVIITFPTPTWLYGLTRGAAELLGIWKFPDERPLTLAEVRQEMAKHGHVLHESINWAVVLTQGVIVARAAGDPAQALAS